MFFPSIFLFKFPIKDELIVLQIQKNTMLFCRSFNAFYPIFIGILGLKQLAITILITFRITNDARKCFTFFSYLSYSHKKILQFLHKIHLFGIYPFVQVLLFTHLRMNIPKSFRQYPQTQILTEYSRSIRYWYATIYFTLWYQIHFLMIFTMKWFQIIKYLQDLHRMIHEL